MLGQHLGEQLVVAIAVWRRRRLIDHPGAARSAGSLAAPYGVPGVHQQVEVGPHGVLVQPDVLSHLTNAERLGARAQQLEDRSPTDAGQHLVVVQGGAVRLRAAHS